MVVKVEENIEDGGEEEDRGERQRVRVLLFSQDVFGRRGSKPVSSTGVLAPALAECTRSDTCLLYSLWHLPPVLAPALAECTRSDTCLLYWL